MSRNEITREVADEQKVWAQADSLEFFKTHRHTPADIYPSERFFLPEVLAEVRTVLDIGCAAGGFSRIMKSFNPAIEYTGVDITPEFVGIASAQYPESHFVLGDGIHFATPPSSYDLVYSTGILHLNTQWKDIVRSAYAQSKQYLLCDFRLTQGDAVEGLLRIDFDGDGVGQVLPYYVVNVDDLVSFLRTLTPAPVSIRARGYYHSPNSTASIPIPRVLMAFFLIEKGDGAAESRIELDFPSANEEQS